MPSKGWVDETDGMCHEGYAVKVGDLPWVRIPSGPSVARPEAIRATKEVTTCVEVLW